MFKYISEHFGITFTNQVQLGLDLGNIVLIIVAITTVTIGYLQIRINRKISREMFAKELHKEYLKLALEYPDLSIGEYQEDDTKSLDRYDTFVSLMLYAFDKMLAIGPVADWVASIEYQVEQHEPYFRKTLHKNALDSYRSNYSKKLMAIIDNAFEKLDQRKRKAFPVNTQ